MRTRDTRQGASRGPRCGGEPSSRLWSASAGCPCTPNAWPGSQRKTLAEIGKKLGRQTLEEVASIVKPDTILAWHRKLIQILRETPSFRAGRKGGGPVGATAEPSGAWKPRPSGRGGRPQHYAAVMRGQRHPRQEIRSSGVGYRGPLGGSMDTGRARLASDCAWQASLEDRGDGALALPPPTQAPCQSSAALAAV